MMFLLYQSTCAVGYNKKNFGLFEMILKPSCKAVAIIKRISMHFKQWEILADSQLMRLHCQRFNLVFTGFYEYDFNGIGRR